MQQLGKRKLLRIATRKSYLALWQANYVANKLKQNFPELITALVPKSTTGDKLLNQSLATIGGKGLFLKELEQSLMAGEADIAVHSMKDVPSELPTGLAIEVVLARENPSDVFLSQHFQSIADLPRSATVGTSSLRRTSLLKSIRPDLHVVDLRGNIDSRINQLKTGKFDGIILAYAGVKRLGLDQLVKQELKSPHWLCAAGQGAIGIESKQSNLEVNEIIASLQHQSTFDCLLAERALVRELEGSCKTPIAAYAEIQQQKIILSAMVGTPDGTMLLKANAAANIAVAETLGKQVAQDLVAQGARKIIKKVGYGESVRNT